MELLVDQEANESLSRREIWEESEARRARNRSSRWKERNLVDRDLVARRKEDIEEEEMEKAGDEKMKV